MTKKQLINSRNLTIINFVIVIYFVLIYLLNYFQVETVLIGVFRELLTIPFLLAEVIFLILGIRFLIQNKREPIVVISLLLLMVCAAITLGSFF